MISGLVFFKADQKHKKQSIDFEVNLLDFTIYFTHVLVTSNWIVIFSNSDPLSLSKTFDMILKKSSPLHFIVYYYSVINFQTHYNQFK